MDYSYGQRFWYGWFKLILNLHFVIQITSEHSDTPKKNSKKKKTKIAGKRSNPPPNEMDSMSFMEGKNLCDQMLG